MCGSHLGRGLKKMNLKVLKCSSCEKLQAPPAYFCTSCRSEELEEREFSGRGVLYTYSTVHVPVPMLEKEAPYTLAIVELTPGCRVTGRLVSGYSEKLVIGAPVELKEIRDGVYLFDFCDGGST
jgi:hypothetical protein